jgi:hypothetical protein
MSSTFNPKNNYIVKMLKWFFFFFLPFTNNWYLIYFQDRFYHSKIPIESKESGIALKQKKVES